MARAHTATGSSEPVARSERRASMLVDVLGAGVMVDIVADVGI